MTGGFDIRQGIADVDFMKFVFHAQKLQRPAAKFFDRHPFRFGVQ